MRIGRICQVQLRLNWFFLLLLLLSAWVGQLLEALVIFAVVVMHELAHIVVAKSYGLVVSELELLPFGGVARIDDLVESDPAVEVQIALAGPIANLLCVALLMLVSEYAPEYEYWRALLVRTNVLLACFNLFPALPLDGGRVLRALLTRRKGFRQATRRAAQLSKVLAICCIGAGLTGFYYGYMNISLLIVGFFIYLAAMQEQRRAMFVLIRYLARKQEELQRKGCLPSEQLVVAAQTKLGEVVRHFVPQRYHLIWIIDQKGHISGMVTELHLLETLFDQGFEVPVSTVLAAQMQQD